MKGRKLTRRQHILVIWNGHSTGTSARLFLKLSDFLSSRHEVRTSKNIPSKGGLIREIWNSCKCNFLHIRHILWCDTLVVHSYAALSLPAIIFGRLLWKKIIIFQWDIYPVVFDGRPLGGRFRNLFDLIEALTNKLSNEVVIPSEDFIPFVEHKSVVVMPLWPQDDKLAVQKPVQNSNLQKKKLKIAFVGQAGRTRGLTEAITAIATRLETDIELHIFGPSKVPQSLNSLAENLKIFPEGNLHPDVLKERISQCDFGLVCLNPKLETPGFPSKSFDYVSADLPILYLGPSLPSFQSLLKETGVGISIDDIHENPYALKQQFDESWTVSKQAFLFETRLDWARLEKIF